MFSTSYFKNQILHINLMFAKITKNIEGKNMMVMFYDN